MKQSEPCVDAKSRARLEAAYMAETPEDEATDSPPDRLSLDPRSEHFDESLLSRGVGIKFNGQEKTNVIEYCVSEGWIRVAAGRSLDRHGQPMTVTLKGEVRPYYDDAPPSEDGDES
jgi:hypothetical protein